MPLWGANTADANAKPKWITTTGPAGMSSVNVIGANASYVADANNKGIQHKGWVYKRHSEANASLSTITIVAGGTGYANGRTLDISGNNISGTSVSITTNGTGGITGFVYTANGSGAAGLPAIRINQPLANVSIVAGGLGYVNTNTLVVTGGGGSGANVTLTTNSTGGIVSFTYNNLGNNYTSVPTVSAPTGTGANLIAVLAGSGANLVATLTGGTPRNRYETIVAL